jgi:general stress protein YciG
MKGLVMSGTKEGALKARDTNIAKYGVDFYKKAGAIGGAAKVPKGFALNRELAREAGRLGGTKSRRNGLME